MLIDVGQTGIAPQHPPRRRIRRLRDDDAADYSTTIAAQETPAIDLCSEYYRTGVEARRRAHAALADVPGLFEQRRGPDRAALATHPRPTRRRELCLRCIEGDGELFVKMS
nr:hypothetical protein GCM10017611_52430 [Rhodococcus wratislaviensis]